MTEEPKQTGTPHTVPGVLVRHPPQADPVPVVFDSPHSGAQYPDDFGYAVEFEQLRSTEDMYVDELFGAAPAHGATLLCALFPRSYIDVNRHPLDLDASLLAEPWPEELQPGDKTHNGKGLIRLQAQGEPIYDRKLEVAEVEQRLAGFYNPYHAELAGAIERCKREFGVAWHVNCHSWTPPFSGRDGKPVRHVDFFLGNRDHTTCGADFIHFVQEFLQGFGYVARVNRLFKGMELVRRHGRPEADQHSLQIEINRNIYMDKFHYGKSEGFAALQEHLTGLIETICDYTRAVN